MKSSLIKSCFVALLAAIACVVHAQPAGSTQQTWLLTNTFAQESLMAVDFAEKDSLVKQGWQINGTGNFLQAPRKETAPVTRLTKGGPNGVDRVFATNAADVAKFVKAGYNNEGVLGYASTKEKEGMLPVYHFTREDRNLWLIKAEDRAWAEKNGWKYVDVGFWLWPIM